MRNARSRKPGQSFFPLSVDYQEKTYAAGKIPGGFFKREGKLRDYEVLISRLIDRPCRPLFPEGYLNEVQVVATVMSFDQENPPDVAGDDRRFRGAAHQPDSVERPDRRRARRPRRGQVGRQPDLQADGRERLSSSWWPPRATPS